MSKSRNLSKAQRQAIEAISASADHFGHKLIAVGNLSPCYGVGLRWATWRRIRAHVTVIAALGEGAFLVEVR